MLKSATRTTLLLMTVTTVGFIVLQVPIPKEWWDVFTMVITFFFVLRKPESITGSSETKPQ